MRERGTRKIQTLYETSGLFQYACRLAADAQVRKERTPPDAVAPPCIHDEEQMHARTGQCRKGGQNSQMQKGHVEVQVIRANIEVAGQQQDPLANGAAPSSCVRMPRRRRHPHARCMLMLMYSYDNTT
eukprot:scaffold2645_cov112-Isochrysis_galbana.AAC.15